MKKQIFISTLRKINLIFGLIKNVQDYYKDSNEKDYDELIRFLHTLSDPLVYTWEKDYMQEEAFFAMNINLSLGKNETSSILVSFLKNGMAGIEKDLNCRLQIESMVASPDNTLQHLISLIEKYKPRLIKTRKK